jgi:hypothetical protein
MRKNKDKQPSKARPKRAKTKSAPTATPVERLIERLRRYKQFQHGVDFPEILVRAQPMDFDLRIGRRSMGHARLRFDHVLFSLFEYAIRQTAPDVFQLPPKAAGAWLAKQFEKKPSGARYFAAMHSYIVQHAPEVLDAALLDLVVEAREHAHRETARAAGRAPRLLATTVAEISKPQGKRMELRLKEAGDDMRSDIARAVGQLGLTKKEDVARELRCNPRTLQRWAARNFSGGWQEAVKFFSPKAKTGRHA